MSDKLPIPRVHEAGALPWIDQDIMYRQLKIYRDNHPSEEGDKRLFRILNEIAMSRGTYSRYVKAPSLNAVHDLGFTHPHFKDVIMHVLGQLAMIDTPGAKPNRIAPMLLLGDPGIGKTRFAHDLAQVLGVTFRVVPMNSLTAGFALSGLDRSWNGSKPGQIFDLLMEQGCINPVVLLDEIDKSNADNRSPTLGPLYQLLESYTAKNHKDEFVQVPIRTHLITWIATANDSKDIPEPLLSRMKVFDIRPPDRQQMRHIVDSMLKELRLQMPALCADMDEAVWNALCGMIPRQANSALHAAAGFASIRARVNRLQRVKIEPQDLQPQSGSKKHKMGF
jgi:ATP-dependent Lon protease